MQRDTNADLLKGYACFLVLIGHVIMGIRKCGQVEVPFAFYNIEKVIWSFHVALFVFVSGHVYRITGGWENKGSRTKFLLNKMVDFGVPYIIFSVIYIVINSMTLAANTNLNIRDIVMLYKKPIAQYWFLYDLFFVFIMYVVLGRFIKNRYVLAGIFLLLYFVKNDISMECVTGIMTYGGFFALGVCFDSLDFREICNKKIFYISASLVMLLHVSLAWMVNMYFNYGLLVKMLITLLGFAGSIAFVNCLQGRSFTELLVQFACRYSMPIYLLHTIFTAGIRVVLLKLHIRDYYVHLIIGAFAGIAIPMVIAVISSRIGWTDFVFYPNRTIKMIKRKKENIHWK